MKFWHCCKIAYIWVQFGSFWIMFVPSEMWIKTHLPDPDKKYADTNLALDADLDFFYNYNHRILFFKENNWTLQTGLRIRIHLIWIRIQHFRLIPIRIQGFWWPKIEKNLVEKNFFIKTTIFLSLGLHKGRPSYKRILQLSKKNI